MIGRPDEEAAIVTDAYIELLLDRQPQAGSLAHDQPMPSQLRQAAELLYSGLPRFHPSFLFEEQLAARLRTGIGELDPAGLTTIRIDPPAALARRLDRRVLLSGAAIASGVSVAAVYAWRHSARRPPRNPKVVA